MALLIIAAIAVLLVLWGISIQRQLVSLDESCKNSMSQIGVQQASRWDALSALAELTKSYDEHEYRTLMDVISQRVKVGAESTAADAQKQEEVLQGAFKKIIAVAEQYPQLKASEMYAKTMESVNTYENQVRMSRMTYNDSVTLFNRMIRQFPDSFVASLLHFTCKDYIEEPKGKTEMPSMNI